MANSSSNRVANRIRISYERVDSPQIQNLQENINRALSQVGYQYADRLEVRFYTSNFPLVLGHDMPKPATDLSLTYLRNTTDDVAPTAGIFIDWIPDPRGVRIRNITGLTAGKAYLLRCFVYA